MAAAQMRLRSSLVFFCLLSQAYADDFRSLPSISDAPSTHTNSAGVIANEIGVDDLPNVVKTYNSNEMRFDRDYRGKSFYGILPFKDAKQTIMSAGTYRIGLGDGSFMSTIDCNVSDPADIARMSDWNPKDNIQVAGRIKDVTFGSVELEPCTMARQQ